MKIERIKKNHKKEIIIGGLILVSIVSAITLVTTRAKYKVTQDIKLAKGTVNYKPYDFKIMAMYQENDSGTYTEINEMPSNGYVVNEEKSYCTADNKTQVKGKLSTNSNGEHIFKNLQKSDKCYIWFDKKPISISDIIAANNPKTTTPDFTQVAITDEGVYAVADGMYGGTSYYWRGAVTNNYVKFAGFCWRIVRINGDNSLRIIYDGSSCRANGTAADDGIITGQTYNSTRDNSSYVGWTYTVGSQRPSNNETATASNAKIQTENWYNTNLKSYESMIANGKFCNDRNVATGSTWTATGDAFNYAAMDRVINKNPTLSCSTTDVYMLKVGAITMDEALYAGALSGGANNNTSFYLNNKKNYHTMTPATWNPGYAKTFTLSYYGYFTHMYSVSEIPGLRPVINLRSDIAFSSGDGTQNNPYVVS